MSTAQTTQTEKTINHTARTMTMTLPEDRTRALRILIGISEQLFDLAERETQALVQNDISTFTILQDEKYAVSQKYANAAEEFRNRLPEFRAADPGLLDRLERLQNELHDKMQSNTRVVENIFYHSRNNVQNSLISVQELSQKAPVKYNTSKEGKR